MMAFLIHTIKLLIIFLHKLAYNIFTHSYLHLSLQETYTIKIYEIYFFNSDIDQDLLLKIKVSKEILYNISQMKMYQSGYI